MVHVYGSVEQRCAKKIFLIFVRVDDCSIGNFSIILYVINYLAFCLVISTNKKNVVTFIFYFHDKRLDNSSSNLFKI